jgi:ketosteroid isomerase-like protein
MTPATAQDIQAANRLFEHEVVAKRNFEALDSVYTRDARILPPNGEMISGRESIKNFWKSALDALNITAVTLETVDFEPLGDTAWEIGRGVLHFGANAPALNAKYVVVWKKEDGLWKWHVDIWNPNS